MSVPYQVSGFVGYRILSTNPGHLSVTGLGGTLGDTVCTARAQREGQMYVYNSTYVQGYIQDVA